MKYLNYPASGSYQGITFSRNRFGQYQRSRATPVNPNSSFQVAVRARMSLNSSNWRDLTAGQRAGWADLGTAISRNDPLGQAYTMTGFMAYCMVNNNKLAAGDATIADAPALAIPDPLVSITPTVTAASFSIAYTVTPLGAGIRAFIYASPQRSPGRTFENDYRLITVTAAAAASPSVILTAYTARFGAPVATNKIFLSISLYLAGFMSPPLTTSVIVA